MPVKMKLRKGDKVVVLSGRDKGMTGEILKVDPGARKVLVQGVQMVKRHMRPSQNNPGGISEFEAMIHASKVALADPRTGQPTRVGYRYLEDGRKVRFAKRSGELID